SARCQDQRLLDGTEVGALAEYLAIASDHGCKVTVFVAGKAALAEADVLSDLVSRYDIELGGHWFDAFPWLFPQQALGRIAGLRRGTAVNQMRDIRATIEAIDRAIGVRIRVWRDHAYRHDRNTLRLLRACGIGAVSNIVDSGLLHPVPVQGLLSVPINVAPD